jgi:hypothetical protein
VQAERNTLESCQLWPAAAYMRCRHAQLWLAMPRPVTVEALWRFSEVSAAFLVTVSAIPALLCMMRRHRSGTASTVR